jgi:hypothetical protein
MPYSRSVDAQTQHSVATPYECRIRYNPSDHPISSPASYRRSQGWLKSFLGLRDRAPPSNDETITSEHVADAGRRMALGASTLAPSVVEGTRPEDRSRIGRWGKFLTWTAKSNCMRQITCYLIRSSPIAERTWEGFLHYSLSLATRKF